MTDVSGFSLRLYRRLLALYPRAFRARFGEGMLDMFADALREHRGHGPFAVARLWLKTILDLLRNIPVAYFRRTEWQDTDPPSSRARTGFGMDSLTHDVRVALRALRHHPVLTAVAVITLALGIGANSAIFSVVNGVLLRALPYVDQERLTVVWTQYPRNNNPQFPVSIAEYLDYRAATEAFSNMGAYGSSGVTITGDGRAERAQAAYPTRSLLDVLGVQPQLGRMYTADEDRTDGPLLALLSYGYWTRRFGADPMVIGNRGIVVNDQSYTIIGVMSEEFTLPLLSADIYLPPQLPDRSTIQNRSGHNWTVIGRLAEGTTLGSASAELDGLILQWEQEFAGNHANDPELHPLTLVSLEEQLFGPIRPAMWALLSAVGLVLLLACANVANLLLARGEARVRELGIRGALGASRGRIARQLLTESLVLALTGGAAGLGVGVLGMKFLTSLDTGGLVRTASVTMDWSVIGFTGGVALLTGLLFGTLPALSGSRLDLTSALGEGSRGGSQGRQSKRALQGLVAFQMALAVILLVGSGLLIKTFLTLSQLDPGFEQEKRVALDLSLSPNRYTDMEGVVRFYDDVLSQLRTTPGIVSAAAARGLPLRNQVGTEGFRIVGQPVAENEQGPSIQYQSATPDYFRTMGIPVVQGRAFDEADRRDAQLVAIINESAADAYFPDQDAVGQMITLSFAPRDWPEVQIVGVVGDVRHRSLSQDPRRELYLPFAQNPDGWAINVIRSSAVVLRTEMQPEQVAPQVRQIVAELDADVPITNLETFEAALADTLAPRRFIALLLGIFAAIAVSMSAVGIYGVMSFTVARRTREIGIRIALGAEPKRVLSGVVKGALAITLVGGGVGLIAAFAGTKVLESMLYNVSTRDTTVFATGLVTILLSALVASIVPAWRASTVNPSTSLRAE